MLEIMAKRCTGIAFLDEKDLSDQKAIKVSLQVSNKTRIYIYISSCDQNFIIKRELNGYIYIYIYIYFLVLVLIYDHYHVKTSKTQVSFTL